MSSFRLSISSSLPQANSALYNASAIQYDPYSGEIKEITFPGVSGDTRYHVGGVDYDGFGHIYFAADYGNAFNLTELGKDLNGPNMLIKYNTYTETIGWIIDVAPFQAEIEAETGELVAGFQDMAEDPRGNIYLLASFGNAIARITPDGQEISVFYNSGVRNVSVTGIEGLFAVGDTLVVSDDRTLGFLVFDTRTEGQTTPKAVRPNGRPTGLDLYMCDGLVAPAKYNGSIALCSIDFLNGTGGIAVYESTDGWNTIDYKGYVKNDSPQTSNSTPTDTVQIADSIYIVEQFFQATPEPVEAKDFFPFIDITAAVDALVALVKH